MSSGGMDSSGWNIRDEDTYQQAVAQLGDPQLVDRALAPIMHNLHRNPTGFSKIPWLREVYLARTRLRIHAGDIIPAVRVWFRAVEATRTVGLLWVEWCPPDDMEYVDHLFDDDVW